MKVESITECSPWSILQYFWPALSDNWSWKPICGLFDSGHFTQVLLYFVYLSTDVDECAVNMTNPCANDGACMNSYGSYYCVCTNGWTGVNCTIGEFVNAVLLTWPTPVLMMEPVWTHMAPTIVSVPMGGQVSTVP